MKTDSDRSRATPEAPKYLQLAARFRRQIATGELKPGDRLPTFAEFRTLYGATPSTVERVLANLERDGLIERRPQKGIHVLGPGGSREKMSGSNKKSARQNTFKVLGYVWPDANNVMELPYWTRLLHGFQEAVMHADAELLLLHPNSVRGWEKVDGIISHLQQINWLKERILTSRIPCVTVMDALPVGPSVGVDDASGIRQAMEHLFALGHRRIGYLIHQQDVMSQAETVRLAAYHSALRSFGIAPQTKWVHNLVNYSEFVMRGQISMEQWLTEGFEATGVTALLIQNDRAAIGAIDSLRARGIRVPEDVSIIGFDGTDECELCRPLLTSVEVPLQQVGAAAVELLLRHIKGEAKAEEKVILPTRLVVRGSTVAPALRGN